MQQQFDVSLPAAFAIPENSEQLKTGLDQLFTSQDTALDNMASAIQYENKPKVGPSAISNLRFDVVRYDPINLNGRLRLWYNMQLTFGCEDFIKDHLNQHSYYDFEFMPGKSLMHFESDASEAPSTADEF